MLRAASTEPAPNPNGTAQTHKAAKLPETENPNSATAVDSTLEAVTMPVPNRLMSFALKMLETTVPADMIMDMIPAQDTGTDMPPYMDGHADPSNESGRPRLINEI